MKEGDRRRLGNGEERQLLKSCQRKRRNGRETGEESGVPLRVCWWKWWCLCLFGVGRNIMIWLCDDGSDPVERDRLVF